MFVFSSDQMSSSPLVESAIKFTEKSQELTEHITALLGSLSSSDTSSALLYATEGMEVSSQHLEQNLRKVQLVEADKIISSAICTANQKDKEKLPENEQTAARKKLLNSTKNIYRKCQHILNDFNQNDIKLSSSVVELATEYETLVKTLPGLSDTEETKHWIQNLGKSLLSLSEYIQDDSSDKEPFTLKTVGEPCTKILTAINESSKKNQIFESVSREFKGIASDIETTIMFASAGTLIPEEDSDFKDSREKILAMAQHLVSDIKAILTGTGQEKSSLVRAVEESLSTTSQLAVEVKRGAAGLSDTNQAGQVSPVDRQLYVENVCNTSGPAAQHHERCRLIICGLYHSF